MSEILFGQSYYLRFDPKLWAAMQPYPPLGTLYAASYLRSRGHDVALFDAMLADSEDEWAQALDLHRPRFAVLFEDNFNYLSKMCLLRMRQAAYTMIGMACQRDCTVIVCGADASDHPSEYLAQGADFVIQGEGEIALAELLDEIKETGYQAIGDKAISHTEINVQAAPRLTSPKVIPRRPELRDLDSLPFPAWDLVDIPRYRKIWLERHGYYSMNMVTTRGCPFHCNWCAKPIWGQRYNVRSPENVAAELAWLKQTYQPDHIWFVDDIFGLKPGWLGRFAEQVEAQGARLPFKCLSRADLLQRPGEVEALQSLGCQIVWVGAESGSQKILDAMEKGTRIEQIYATARRLHAAGIQVGFFLQFGYPGENRTDIEKTLQMVRDCHPDDIGMSVSYPLPGTRFFAAVKEQLGAQQNWIDSSDLAMLYQGPYTTAFYRQLHTVLHKEFRLRKALRRMKGSASPKTTFSGGPAQRSAFKDLRTILFNGLTLPLARWKLNRLEHLPHTGLAPLPVQMSHEEASKPTPQ